ncbi:MAG: CoA transferase, partial [Deltaproteobacteria bacterium]|nr:CoA transferase [Deltaproteobacteria bacterium]
MTKEGALHGVRVLEISHAAGAVAGHILADLGAEVIKVEPPGGEAARLKEPKAEVKGGHISYFWLAYNVGKKSIVIDLSSPAGLAEFVGLAATADIVVTDFERLTLEENDAVAAAARTRNPALVWAEVWPYGRGKPHENYPGGELVAQATGGHLYLNGDEDRAPVMIGVATATVQAGVEAAAGALSAYFHVLQTGQGQRIDVSMQQCVVWTLLMQTMLAQMIDREYKRGGEVKRERANTYFTRLVWPCRDGHIYYAPIGGGGGSAREKSFAALVAWMAESGVTDPILTARDWINTSPISQEQYDEVAKVIYDFLVTKTKKELMDRALQNRILLAPVNDIPEIMDNPQLRAR